MPVKTGYRITSSFIEGILEIKIIGKLSEINEYDLQKDLFTLVSGLKGPKALLIDMREMRGRPYIGATYHRVRKAPYYDLFAKTAIIDLVENRTYYSFHETTAANAGHSLRYFNDRDDAVAWLKNGGAVSSYGSPPASPMNGLNVLFK